MASSSTQMMMQRPSDLTAQKKQLNENADVLTQQTSLELVQILLLVTFSSILYLRAPFGTECFKIALFDEQMTYKTFKSQKNDLSTKDIPEANQKSLRAFKVLTRGANGQIDQLLDWIELGLADALSKKCLKSAQLAFFHQELNTDSAVEVYTMSFEYREGGVEITHIERSLESQGTKSDSQEVSVNLARDQVRGTVARLVAVMQALDDLPDDMLLTMQLNYNEHRPEGYQPPGFKESDVRSTLPEETGVLMGKILTGHYNVSLGYSVEGKQPSSKSKRADHQPDNLGLRLPLSAPTNLKLDAGYTRNNRPSTQVYPRQEGSERFSDYNRLALLYKTYGQIPVHHGNIWRDHVEYLRKCNAAHIHVYNNGYHAMEAAHMRDNGLIPEFAYQRKMNTAYNYQHTTAPGALKRKVEIACAVQARSNAPSQLAITESTSQIGSSQGYSQVVAVERMAVSRNADNVDTQQQSPTIDTWNPKRTKHIANFKFKSSWRRLARLHSKEEWFTSPLKIRCECEATWAEPEGMLQCTLCGYGQHPQCYGYFGNDDYDLIPTVHICYGCIFKTDPVQLEEMTELCKFRLFLYCLLTEKGDHTKLKQIKCDRDKVDAQLERDGYVKRIHRSIDYDKLVIDAKQIEQLFQFPFDPRINIHRCTTVESTEDSEDDAENNDDGDEEIMNARIAEEDDMDFEDGAALHTPKTKYLDSIPFTLPRNGKSRYCDFQPIHEQSDEEDENEDSNAEEQEQSQPRVTSLKTNLQAYFLSQDIRTDIVQRRGGRIATEFPSSADALMPTPTMITSEIKNPCGASTALANRRNFPGFQGGSSTQGSPSPVKGNSSSTQSHSGRTPLASIGRNANFGSIGGQSRSEAQQTPAPAKGPKRDRDFEGNVQRVAKRTKASSGPGSQPF